MTSGRRYSVGAAIADFYITSIAFGAVMGIYVAAASRPVPLWSALLAAALTVMFVVAYHSTIAARVAFRTAGEVMMGRVVVDGRKQWVNPYGINRIALFLVLFIGLVGAGNLWDSVANERFYTTITPPVVVGRVLIISCLLIGLMMVGRAAPAGGLLVMVYFTLTAVASLAAEPVSGVPAAVIQAIVIFNLLMALAAAVVLWAYYRVAARNRPHLTGLPPSQPGIAETTDSP